MDDSERAAERFNTCRKRGINAVELLICAVAHHRDWSTYTLDRDFAHYARNLRLKLLN